MSQKPTTAQNATLTCTERHDTGPEVAGVEGNVDTRQRDRRETALKSDVTLLGLQLLCLRVARVDDLAQHLFHLINSELLGEL